MTPKTVPCCRTCVYGRPQGRHCTRLWSSLWCCRYCTTAAVTTPAISSNSNKSFMMVLNTSAAVKSASYIPFHNCCACEHHQFVKIERQSRYTCLDGSPSLQPASVRPKSRSGPVAWWRPFSGRETWSPSPGSFSSGIRGISGWRQRLFLVARTVCMVDHKADTVHDCEHHQFVKTQTKSFWREII